MHRERKWVTGSIWPNCPTHQSDIFFQQSKGQRWHRMTLKVSSTSSQHAKTPDLKCHQRMFLVSCNAQLNFTHVFFCATVTSSTKCVRARCSQTESADTGWKWMSSGWATDGAGRRAGRKMCLPLKSPTAVRHNTIRLEIVFPLPSPNWFLLSPGYSLSSALLLCIVIMQKSPHRSLVQLISEVAALQIEALNLVPAYICW